MKDAIGGSALLNLVVFIVGTILLLLVNSLTYSKAFKVKNRIINIIEKQGTYDEIVSNEISTDLGSIGYELASNTLDCKKTTYYQNEILKVGKSIKSANVLNTMNSYDYCVYEIIINDNSKYYGVVAYTHFSFPIIGSFVHHESTGETKILKDYEINDPRNQVQVFY